MSHRYVNIRNPDALWLYRWSQPIAEANDWKIKGAVPVVVVEGNNKPPAMRERIERPGIAGTKLYRNQAFVFAQNASASFSIASRRV